jgi:hypothetical protein
VAKLAGYHVWADVGAAAAKAIAAMAFAFKFMTISVDKTLVFRRYL